MEAQSPPAKIARVADTGEGIRSMMTMKAEPVPIGLGLGLGPDGLNHGKSGFTFLQLQELEQQALIFKYMVAGVPVPLHLVLPIWKTVVSAYGGGVNGSIYHHYPSFLGCNGLSFDYRNSMEPEPGRCRRTDGKKWRCSKDVVPDQKYCERHMHRGRQRSRKHVETSQITTTAAAAAVTVAVAASNNNNIMNSNTNLSISILTNNDTTITTNPNTTSNSNNVSPRLGFSPKSVLQAGTSSKTESSL